MFRPSKIVADAFVQRLQAGYRKVYGEGPPGHLEIISLVARMALSRLARSNALYHNLDHTMMVAVVGEDILCGRLYRDGDVRSIDWVHFVISSLLFAVGFTRNLCAGDKHATCVIDAHGNTIELPRGATDGYLWPYFTERSKLFVRQYFRDHHIVDAEILAEQIEYCRFPPPADGNAETSSFPGLLRAAQVIGAIADPDFSLKIMRLWLELKECEMHKMLGFESPSILRDNYPQFFWTVLYPLIPEGIEFLTYTGGGRLWLANMHAHVLLEEHRDNETTVTVA
ncbi:MAG: metal-dependent phosphohydrolase [Gammaproteobacteria bacterium]|nr:metal-dependent phosphohydrolase [Gammaproteobacteria bacterium]